MENLLYWMSIFGCMAIPVWAMLYLDDDNAEM